MTDVMNSQTKAIVDALLGAIGAVVAYLVQQNFFGALDGHAWIAPIIGLVAGYLISDLSFEIDSGQSLSLDQLVHQVQTVISALEQSGHLKPGEVSVAEIISQLLKVEAQSSSSQSASSQSQS
jgi:hypothetical protein